MSSPDQPFTDTPQQDDLLTFASEEERNEILAEIEEVVKQNQITVSDEIFRLNPLKRSFWLPTIIITLSIAAVGATFYLSSRMFETRQESMNLEVSAVASAEGRLIEELKRESDARIAAKEEEILRIQEELGKIEEQSKNLQSDFQTALERREIELRAEMESALLVERARLQKLDITPEELDNRLRDFEIQKQQELQAKIEEYRIESQAALRAKEEELARSRDAAQQILVQTNAEKEKLAADAAEREAELTARYEAERQALTAESSDARARLEEIARLQETENLVTDQILAFYQSIMNSMENGQYEAALTGIASLRTLLDDPKIDNLPRIAKRRGVERLILDTLEGEIEVELNTESADTGDLVNTAQRLLNARALVAQAETAKTEGRRDEARELYNQAITALPSIKAAVENLALLETEARNSRADRLLAQGQEFLETGATDQALSSYRLAAAAAVPGESERLVEAVKRIENTITSEYTDNQNRLTADSRREIDDLKAEYETRIAELEAEAAARDQELSEEAAALLETIETLKTEAEDRDTRIAEQEALISEGRTMLAEYEDQLNQAQTELAAAREQLSALEESKGSLSDEQLAELKAEQSGTVDEKNRTIASLNTRVSELSTQLSTSRKELSTAQTSLSRSEEQRKQLEKDLDAAVVELVDVVTRRQGDDRYTALAKGYTAYQANLNSLLGGNVSASDYTKAEQVLQDFFRDSEISGIFPGLDEYTRKVTEYRAGEARSEALSITEQYASYLEEGNSSAAERIENESGEDPLLRKVFTKIRSLFSAESTP